MSLFSDKSVLVFDMDGTLVDSMTHFGDLASRVICDHYGKNEKWARKAYRDTSGLPFPFQLERLFPADSRNLKAAQDFFDQKQNSYHEAPFYSDMESTLTELKKRGYQTAISSNNEHDLLLKKMEEKKRFFDLIFGFRPSFSKGRDHFMAIADMLGVALHEMVFVGDSLHDAQMARDNDLSFVAKLGTFSKADFERQQSSSVFIDNLSELTSLLNDDSTLKAYRDTGRGVRHSAGR